MILRNPPWLFTANYRFRACDPLKDGKDDCFRDAVVDYTWDEDRNNEVQVISDELDLDYESKLPDKALSCEIEDVETLVTDNSSTEEADVSALNRKNNSLSNNANGQHKTLSKNLKKSLTTEILSQFNGGQASGLQSTPASSTIALSSATALEFTPVDSDDELPAAQPGQQGHASCDGESNAYLQPSTANLKSPPSSEDSEVPPVSGDHESPPVSKDHEFPQPTKDSESSPLSDDHSPLTQSDGQKKKLLGGPGHCEDNVKERQPPESHFASGSGSGSPSPHHLQDEGGGSSDPGGSLVSPRGEGDEGTGDGRDGKSNRKNSGRKKRFPQPNEKSDSFLPKYSSPLLGMSPRPPHTTSPLTSPQDGPHLPLEDKSVSSSQAKKPPDPQWNGLAQKNGKGGQLLKNPGRKRHYQPSETASPRKKKPPDDLHLKELALLKDGVVSQTELSPTGLSIPPSPNPQHTQLLLPCEETPLPRPPAPVSVNTQVYNHTQAIKVDPEVSSDLSSLIENGAPLLELTPTGEPLSDTSVYKQFSGITDIPQPTLELEEDYAQPVPDTGGTFLLTAFRVYGVFWDELAQLYFYNDIPSCPIVF